MPDCHHMNKGDLYECTHCGLRIEVVRECHACGQAECDHPDHDDTTCVFRCCGHDLEPVK